MFSIRYLILMVMFQSLPYVHTPPLPQTRFCSKFCLTNLPHSSASPIVCLDVKVIIDCHFMRYFDLDTNLTRRFVKDIVDSASKYYSQLRLENDTNKGVTFETHRIQLYSIEVWPSDSGNPIWDVESRLEEIQDGDVCLVAELASRLLYRKTNNSTRQMHGLTKFEAGHAGALTNHNSLIASCLAPTRLNRTIAEDCRDNLIHELGHSFGADHDDDFQSSQSFLVSDPHL